MNKEETLRIFAAFDYAISSVALDGEERGSGQRRRINQVLHGLLTIDSAIVLALAEHRSGLNEAEGRVGRTSRET